MSQLLDEVVSYFPSPYQWQSAKQEDWQHAIAAIQTRLISLSRTELEALYVEGRHAMLTVATHQKWSIKYWIFSHPSFEIFEQFLSNTDLLNLFSRLLDYVATSECVGNRRERRTLRRRLRVGDIPLWELTKQYCALLTERGWTHGLLKKKDGRTTLTLARWHLSHHQVLEFCRTKERSLASERLLRLEIERDNASKRARVWYPILDIPIVDSREPLSTFEVEDVITSLSIDGFEVTYPPGDWKKLEDCLRIFTARGKWPKFGESIVYAVEIKGARSIQCTCNEELMTDVLNVYHMYHQKIERWSTIEYGLLPIGLKIHCATANPPGKDFLSTGYFAAHNAGTCFNLPPVGNMRMVQELFQLLKRRAGVNFLNNPDYQIQVCTPGVLTGLSAAILGMCFYLGSDQIRFNFAKENFITTHSETGGRLVIQGAGVVDRKFQWWRRGLADQLLVEPLGDEFSNRTDVLMCQSLQDIETVNLVATLLVHATYGGYWSVLGRTFEDEAISLFKSRGLAFVLTAQWVSTRRYGSFDKEQTEYFDVLCRLASYATAQAHALEVLRQQGDREAARGNLLYDMQELLAKYRTAILVKSVEARREP